MQIACSTSGPGPHVVEQLLTGSSLCPLQDAPYLLEACAQGFANEEAQVQLAMLSAVMKLFFKRPPECQQLLGATLAAAAAEPSQDVHDRALLYYRCFSELL